MTARSKPRSSSSKVSAPTPAPMSSSEPSATPAREIPFDWYSARWTGRIRVPPSSAGVRRLAVEGNDGYRLYLDGKLVIDNWKKQSYGVRFADVDLRPGMQHNVRLEYFESTGNARLKLLWDVGRDTLDRMRRAVALAALSDLTLVVAGIEEGEFRDRASLRLPGRQEELIRAVAATGTPVVVVLIGGGPVVMTEWLHDVEAVLAAWYPGDEGGPALARCATRGISAIGAASATTTSR